MGPRPPQEAGCVYIRTRNAVPTVPSACSGKAVSVPVSENQREEEDESVSQRAIDIPRDTDTAGVVSAGVE